MATSDVANLLPNCTRSVRAMPIFYTMKRWFSDREFDFRNLWPHRTGESLHSRSHWCVGSSSRLDEIRCILPFTENQN